MGDKKYNILMINHHRRFKSYFRSQIMAENLVERGHKVTLVVISDNNRLGVKYGECKGVRIIETPDMLWGNLRSGWDFFNTLVRKRLLRSLPDDFDLIHIFETRPVTIFPVISYLKKKKLPLFIDWIDWWGGKGGLIEVARPKWYRYTFGRIEEFFEVHYRPMADGTTVISTALAKRAEGLGLAPDTILHLRGGVDLDHFRPMDITKARKKAGLSEGSKVLGFSSFDSHLDFKLLMESLIILIDKFPDIKIVVTGKATDRARDMIASYNLSDRVIQTGFLPYKDLPIYLSACDVLLLPFPETVYNLGRWPNKIGDYMAVGRPVVTNPIGDLKDIFSSSDYGLGCEYSAEAFARSITRLLDDESLCAEMGKNSRRWAEQNLSWKKKVLVLEDFYDRIVKSR